MREIKFRVWDGDGYVREGWYIGNKIYAMRNCQSLDPNEEVLEQFTGLRDKNGKEIYEGDIVLVGDFKDYGDGPEWGDHSTHSIKWMDGYPAFDLSPQLDTDCNGLQYALEVQSVEVIGNIHENKELLKGANNGN